MEKIAIQLWKKNDIDEDDFKNFLVKKVPSSLADIASNYQVNIVDKDCLLYTSPSPRDATLSRMPSSA